MNLEQDRDGILLGNRLLICEAEIGYVEWHIRSVVKKSIEGTTS